MTSFDYTKVDLYDILGIEIDATEKDVIKAYRKKALKYHPDKNPDPSAVEIFHKLSKALEILTDERARAAYDKVLKARAAAQVRHRQLDAKRQKLKEDLDAREQAVSSEQQKKTQAKNLQAEVERLRREGSALLQREQELFREQLAKQAEEQRLRSTPEEVEPIVLKLKWKCSKSDTNNSGYNKEVITSIFSKYGDVANVILGSKRNGTAVLEYKRPSANLQSVENERGLSSCPLVVKWMSGKPSSSAAADLSNFADHSAVPLSSQTEDHKVQDFGGFDNFEDFEQMVLSKMEKGEPRKRPANQEISTDNGDT